MEPTERDRADTGPRVVLERWRHASISQSVDEIERVYAVDAVHEFPFTSEGLPTRLEGRDNIVNWIAAGWKATSLKYDRYRTLAIHDTADPDSGHTFLFTLDDGCGDLLDRPTDAGLVALGGTEAQLRIGEHWGPVVDISDTAQRLVDLAAAFQDARGDGPDAPWHIRELPRPLTRVAAADPRLPAPAGPLTYGAVPGGFHMRVPDGVLTAELGRSLLPCTEVVVTPWHGVFIPEEAAR